MKKIFFIKSLDILSFFYLYIFFCNKSSEIHYRNCTNLIKKLENIIFRLTKIKILLFKNELFLKNTQSIFYKNQYDTNKISYSIAELITRKKTIFGQISKKINKEVSKTIFSQYVSTEIFDYILFKNYIENSFDDTYKYFICADVHDLFDLLKQKISNSNFQLIKISTLRNITIFRILYFLFQIIVQIFLNIFKFQSKSKITPEKKIAVNYGISIDSPLSEHWWLKDLKIKKNNIIFLFSEFGKIPLNDKLIKKIQNYGYKCEIIDYKLNKTSNKITKRIIISSNILISLLKKLISIYFYKKKYQYYKFQFVLWLKIAFKVEKYRKFLINENIQIILDHTEASIDIMGIASKKSGITKIYYQRSDIYFPMSYFQPIHDVFFTWGDLSKVVFSEYHHNKITKFINVGNLFYSFPKLEKLRENALSKIKNNLDKDIILNLAVFDRSSSESSYIPPKYHSYFYDKVIELSENNKINLLIKPKQPIKDEILNYRKIRSRIHNLIDKKKLFLFNHQDSIYEAACLSNASLSIGLNTAGVMGAVMGTTPFFWDVQKTSNSTYQKISEMAGFNNEFFISEDLDTLFDNIKKYLVENKLSLGINERFVKLRNHFDDKKALNRISKEIDKIIKN